MGYQLTVDVGGTFTDLMVLDEKGEARLFKTPSDPVGPDRGVQEVLKQAARTYRMELREFLAQSDRLVHGTTVSTNAVLQRKGVKTALLVTGGHRQMLWTRDGYKRDVFNLKMRYPTPYVPIYLTLPVEERIDRFGKVLKPLNEEEVRGHLRQFKKWDIKSIGVCFLWSIVNPAHERRVGEIIEEEWPEVSYSLSHEVQPVIREFVRSSACVLDASLKPIVSEYCRRLQSWLSENGFRYDFLMVVASGGVVGVRESVRRPVYIIFSGPTVGPVAGLFYGEERGTKNIITVDMGGTSFDVGAAIDGTPVMTGEARIADWPTGITSVEINSIGSGGGSIAWVDDGGMLHVGPQSAGAFPGPACYMRGGEEPTVSDANLLLGYLDPDFFLGGTMRLDPGAAYKVVKPLATNLKIDVVEAANAIFNLVNTDMANAMLTITMTHGLEPRDFLLVCGGGAGPTHVAWLAKELGMTQVLMPKWAGGLCAVGMLNSDVKFEMMGTCFAESVRFRPAEVNPVLEEMEARGKVFLDAQGIPEERRRLEYFMEARYPGQVYNLRIPLEVSRVREETLPKMVADFHEAHEKRYFVCEQDAPVEMVNWGVTSIGLMPKASLQKHPFAGKDSSTALKGKRKVYFAG
ncbi:MAG: hydantoinase/oxoprolinase family protein, partial [Candidatus Binatia bacterium]|nr:hydantoinase/oxoprolinase family protein [Candidatus Binatia bacterium]